MNEIKQESRILIKRSTTPGEVPTIPLSLSHTDGTWLPTDIYEGELFINIVDEKVWFRGATIQQIYPVGASASQDVFLYADLASFPVTGTVDKLYVAKDTSNGYWWDSGLSTYELIGTTASISWSSITNGPSSTPIQIDDAVSLAHDINAINTSHYTKVESDGPVGASGAKVDKRVDYDLSKNDFTDAYKAILDAGVTQVVIENTLADFPLPGDETVAYFARDDKEIWLWDAGLVNYVQLYAGNTDKLNELVDVSLTGLTGGQILQYNSSLGVWENVNHSLLVSHNDTSGLQGGTASEYYHLASSQHTIATQAASGSQSGYLSSTDFTTFSNKLSGLTASNHNDLANRTASNAHPISAITDLQSKLDTPWIDINRYGFLNQTETTINFDGIDLFTLSSVGASWSYYRAGIKYTITGNKTVTVASPMVDGQTYFIYIDGTDGTLLSSTTAWTLNDTKVLVAIVKWDSTATPNYILLEERHTCLIDRRWHLYAHKTFGTRVAAVGALTGYAINTDTNASKTFAIAQSEIFDEDIYQILSSFNDPDGTATNYIVAYRNASLTAWKWKKSNMPFIYNVGNTNDWVQWDNAGTMTDATGGAGGAIRFVNSYLVLTNGQNDTSRYMIVPGRGIFTSLALAQAEDFTSFDLTGFPPAEAVAVYQLSWTTVTSTSQGKCRLAVAPKRISTNIIATTGAVAGTDHETLSGLLGGIANEHYHLDSAQHTIATQAASASQSGYLSTTDWTTFNNKPGGTGSTGKLAIWSNTNQLSYDNTISAETSQLTIGSVGGGNTYTTIENTSIIMVSETYNTINRTLYDNTANPNSSIVQNYYKYRGTAAIPSPLLANDYISVSNFDGGYSGNLAATSVQILVQAAENFSLNNNGTSYLIKTTAIGENSVSDRFKITGTGAIRFNDQYTFPLLNATSAGQVLTDSDGSGTLTWSTITSGGNVTKVGTPVNNQLAIWTGDGTLEGTSDVTYDGTNFNIITGKNFQIAGSVVLYDSSGTTTLSNIDALDSTTNSTIKKTTVVPRLFNTTSLSSLTPDLSLYDMYVFTSLTTALTIDNPSGSPENGRKLVIRIKDNGTARGLTWGTQFRSIGATLPTTTVISKVVYIGLIYNTDETKWDCIAVSQQA